MSEHRFCVHGDIDLATAGALRAGLREAIRSTDSHFVVDCTFLTFIDSTGIAVLLEANRDLEERGREMAIVNVPRASRRVFDLLGLTDLLQDDHEPAV